MVERPNVREHGATARPPWSLDGATPKPWRLVALCAAVLGCGSPEPATHPPNTPAKPSNCATCPSLVSLSESAAAIPARHEAAGGSANEQAIEHGADREAASANSAEPQQTEPSDDWRWSSGFLTEWMAKRESHVPGHELRYVHLVFEEWFGAGHVRVSVRANGWYAIEVDGIGGWNHWGGKGKRRALPLYTGSRGGFSFIEHFNVGNYLMGSFNGEPAPAPIYLPCPHSGDDGKGDYHASLTVSAEFATLAVFRSWWTSPDCPGFPRNIALDAWDLVERVSGGALQRPPWHEPAPAGGTSGDGPTTPQR